MATMVNGHEYRNSIDVKLFSVCLLKKLASPPLSSSVPFDVAVPHLHLKAVRYELLRMDDVTERRCARSSKLHKKKDFSPVWSF